jgi:hypothetical protein
VCVQHPAARLQGMTECMVAGQLVEGGDGEGRGGTAELGYIHCARQRSSCPWSASNWQWQWMLV